MKALSLALTLEDIILTPEQTADMQGTVYGLYVDRVRLVANIYGSQKPSKGLDEDEREHLRRITDAIKKAQKENKDAVELEDADAGFIRKAFKCDYNYDGVIARIETLVKAIPDR